MKVTDGSYCGTMGWTNSGDTNFDNFIIKNSMKELSVDIKYKDGQLMVYEYTVVLNRIENDLTYRGTWSDKSGNSGGVNCQLFDYGDDILLFGNWTENNKPLKWWAILSNNED